MRKIKFRAWDTVQEKMSYDVDVYSSPGPDDCWWTGNYCDPETYDTISSFHYGHLMQFTGLYDKNGKEIYEGDVVKYIASERFNERNSEVKTVVKYNDSLCGFAPMCFHKEVEDGWYDYKITAIEVIGNIYENPELCEQ